MEEHRLWPAPEFLRRVQEALVPLYASGMSIPDVEPTTEDQPVSRLTHEDWSARFNALLEHLGPHSRYWEIYDPIEPEPDDPVAGNLADDLADIYRDLQDGLGRWEHRDSQHKQDALWQWRFSFQSHWGAHAVDAIRAIHWLLHEHYIEALEDDGEAPMREDA